MLHVFIGKCTNAAVWLCFMYVSNVVIIILPYISCEGTNSLATCTAHTKDIAGCTGAGGCAWYASKILLI